MAHLKKPTKDGTSVVVTDVNIVKTLMAIPTGKSVRYTREEFPVREMSVYSAISRLNAKDEPGWFSYEIAPNGDFIISRK